MTREQAIQAVQETVEQVPGFVSKRLAGRILDAVGWREPVGYAVIDDGDIVSAYSPYGLDDALDEAREIGARVAALIPLSTQP